MPAAVDRIINQIAASLRKAHPGWSAARIRSTAIATAISRGLIHSSGGHLKLGRG